jgi:L-cystine uptake protein TcyP (sodium:dicarboxylate symporter family)
MPTPGPDSTPTPTPPIDVPATILGMVPSNLFAALSDNSVLPVVFIAALVGFANIAVKRKAPAASANFESALDSARHFVMEIVLIVINFTPYGVLGMVAVRAAEGDVASLLNLGLIVGAAFTAMRAIFVMHMVICIMMRVNPVTYVRKASAPLVFAFNSRSSSATLPMTIKAMQSRGVTEATANLAATLGTCIGQNACSGMQPAIVVVLTAKSLRRDVWDFQFLIQLVLFAVIASIGTAGVGGGARNVSIMVLSMFGFGPDLVAGLLSADFLIDMGRTLINVNGSIVAGLFASRVEKTLDVAVLYDGKFHVEETAVDVAAEGSCFIDPGNEKSYTPGTVCSVNL